MSDAEAQLRDIATRLYGVPAAEFVAARNDEVRTLKASGARALADRVASFARPSAGADLVNRLVRDSGDLVREVRELGARLRAAQPGSTAAELRTLDGERRALVGRCVEAARATAQSGGARATAAALRDVEQTVWAALVDAGACAVLEAGALVRPMSPSGFGEVDLAGTSAVPVEVDDSRTESPAAKRADRGVGSHAEREKAERKEIDRREVERKDAERRARKQADDASAALRAADLTVEDAARRVEESRHAVSELLREQDALRRRLAEIEKSARAAEASLRAAEQERDAAAAEVDRTHDDLRAATDQR